MVLKSPFLHQTIFWFMTLSTAFTVWGMWALRRSFSITVEARELVASGPYRFIRHPIYSGEIAAATTVALWRFSWPNIALLAIFIGIQLTRARMEEVKLELNFPEYREYAKRTWWVWG
jgi:protein-S-isoprenylcysteine O-methyltransferase Ste14